ncbi:MAG TPA: polyprenol monophosphomannose synthase [Polyangiaceae bacterium]|jgi:dolichol-phosphate mannosyltransferase|nr:polyprenol monophosphomannose synthase [Polyangiaceae bacterium]
MTRVLVVTPTYDERDNLEPFCDALFAALPSAHLLVIDDASPDGTGALAAELASRDERIRVSHRARKLGLGTAYVSGFLRALDDGYDVVVEMDADLSHDARALPDLLAALERGADVAVGSRNVPGGGIVGWGPGRLLLSRGGSFYARSILGVAVRDMTTGFKAYTRSALEAIDVASLRSEGYAFQIETTYRALRRGLTVVEVPIVFTDRRAGRSKLDRSVVLEAVVAPWRLRFARF